MPRQWRSLSVMTALLLNNDSDGARGTEAEGLALANDELGSALFEAGGEIGAEGLVGVHSPGAFQENLLAFGDIWVGNAAVYRADGRALFLVKESDTLGAFLGSYIINVFLDRGIGRAVEFPRRSSLVDGRVRALGLTRAAVDALFGNQGRHIPTVPRNSHGPDPRDPCRRLGPI